jgi:hypothetical protein
MAFKFNPTTGKLDTVADPGGTDTQIQFNNAGSFEGSTDLSWDDTTKVLGIGGDIDLDDGGTYTTTLQTITPTAARTISFPDATGTVGLVGGSSGNLVVNQSGAYAGVANSSVDNATGNVTLGSRFISSLNGTASAPPGTFTGTWFTGGTATTTKPQVLIEPTGTTSTAWSTAGTGLGVNAASGFAGNLLDLQLNGTSRAVVTEAGNVGIGTTSPSVNLEVRDTYPEIYLNSSGTVLGGLRADMVNKLELKTLTTAPLSFQVNSSEKARIDSSGRLLVGTSADTGGSLFQVNGNRIRIATAKTPASATDTGSAGEICWDADYIYVCTATNTWKRTAISTW